MADDTKTPFSERLLLAMKDLAFTQSRLAELVDTSQAAVSQWTTGKKAPTPENLTALAKALGVRREWLEFGIGTMMPVDISALREQHQAQSQWGFRPAP